MNSIREVLDSNRTLPDIRLDSFAAHDFGYLTRDRFFILEKGNDEPIGKCDIVGEIDNDVRFAHFDGIEIAEEKRGKGIGLATYVLAIEFSHSRGFDFETQNYELTPYSKKIWELLAEKSIAQVITPFTASTRFDDRFVGKYRIPSPTINTQ